MGALQVIPAAFTPVHRMSYNYLTWHTPYVAISMRIVFVAINWHHARAQIIQVYVIQSASQPGVTIAQTGDVVLMPDLSFHVPTLVAKVLCTHNRSQKTPYSMHITGLCTVVTNLNANTNTFNVHTLTAYANMNSVTLNKILT